MTLPMSVEQDLMQRRKCLSAPEPVTETASEATNPVGSTVLINIDKDSHEGLTHYGSLARRSAREFWFPNPDQSKNRLKGLSTVALKGKERGPRIAEVTTLQLGKQGGARVFRS